MSDSVPAKVGTAHGYRAAR